MPSVAKCTDTPYSAIHVPIDITLRARALWLSRFPFFTLETSHPLQTNTVPCLHHYISPCRPPQTTSHLPTGTSFCHPTPPPPTPNFLLISNPTHLFPFCTQHIPPNCRLYNARKSSSYQPALPFNLYSTCLQPSYLFSPLSTVSQLSLIPLTSPLSFLAHRIRSKRYNIASYFRRALMPHLRSLERTTPILFHLYSLLLCPRPPPP